MLILACTTGYYGKNCSIPCSPSCNGTCGYKDGSCNVCKDGRESHCAKGCYTSLSFERSLFYVLIYVNWYAYVYLVNIVSILILMTAFDGIIIKILASASHNKKKKILRNLF